MFFQPLGSKKVTFQNEIISVLTRTYLTYGYRKNQLSLSLVRVTSLSKVVRRGGGGRLVGLAAENPRETKRYVTHINVFKLGETSCTASGVGYLVT